MAMFASTARRWTPGDRARAEHCSTRMPTGSVVSFMLPNWHEAAVIYLAATLAGMVVNPILPSLRDRELQFILADAASRMIFVPSEFGGHDYASMLSRVTAQLADRHRRSSRYAVMTQAPTLATPLCSRSSPNPKNCRRWTRTRSG